MKSLFILMEDNQVCSSNEAYRSLTNTILNVFEEYKNGAIEDVSLNEKMLVNVFSMIKILDEHQKSISNEEGFDEYVPGYKLDNETKMDGFKISNGLDIKHNNDKIYEESFMKKPHNSEPSFIDLDNDIFFTENESQIININNDNAVMSLIPNSIFNDAPNNNKNDIFSSPFEHNNNKPISISQKAIVAENINKKKPVTNNSQPIAFSSKKIEGNISYNSDSINKQISFVNNTLLSTLDTSEARFLNKSCSFLPKIPSMTKEISNRTSYDKPMILSDKIKEYYLMNMNENYLLYMNILYNKMKEESKSIIPLWNDNDQYFFINVFKKYILSIGISYKKFYEDCLRQMIYQKEKFTIENFLNCFQPLLKYSQKDGIIKYKCIYLNVFHLISFA